MFTVPVAAVALVSICSRGDLIIEFEIVPVVIVGLEIVGPVPNTRAPEPVSSVIAEARFALDGVPRNVATFVPKPETAVLIGIVVDHPAA
mgnify:CR=1 FL=1